MRNLKIFFLVLSLLLFVHVSPTTVTATESQPTTLSVEQSMRLRETLQQQEATLLMLKSRYQMLKIPSKELVIQLEKAENELKICKGELASARNSLTEAYNSIEKLKQSLTKLETAISNERKKARITRLQRDLWCGITITSGVATLIKTIKK